MKTIKGSYIISNAVEHVQQIKEIGLVELISFLSNVPLRYAEDDPAILLLKNDLGARLTLMTC